VAERPFIPIDAAAIGPQASGAWSAISDAAFRLYVCLASHRNGATDQCNPSTATLARETSKHRGTIYRSLELLESAGWIGIERRAGGRNSYTFPPIPTYSASATGCTGATSSASATKPVAPAQQNQSRQREQNKMKRTRRTNKTKTRAARDDHGEAFAAWWEVYPRKVAKPAALKAYARAIASLKAEHDGTADQWLLARTRQFAQSPAGQAGRYCPHPATWLNQERFNDDPQEWDEQDGHEKHAAGPGQRHPADTPKF